MTTYEMQKAEYASRVRARIMAVMAAVLLIIGFLGFGDEASSMDPVLRHASWGVMIFFWLIILATGGWLRLDKRIRSVMNDEGSLANRSKALQAGFWVAMALGLALYFASFEWQLSVREGLRMLIDVAIAAALLRYAWLEMR